MPRAWVPAGNWGASGLFYKPGSSLRPGHEQAQARGVRASTREPGGTPELRVAKPSLVEASADVVDYFSSINRWIVFSDLHVHERYTPHWRSCLHSVSQIATDYNAGCIFLGDFWDARENVPHRLLRQVESELRDWSHPTISITGNHDQASLSGAEHNMGILERICPSWRVLSAPTLLNNAAWIPYRADREELQQLLAAARELPEPPRAMFVHADITGARYNTRQQAHVGLGTEAFPSDIPTYSGHYHLPHTVPNTSITYVGSPFQLNFGEEGETKRVLLLDGHFQPLKSIPLTCGPRHHTLPWASRGDWLRGCGQRFDGNSVLRVTAPATEQAAAAKARDELISTGARVSVILDQPLLARLQPPAAAAAVAGEHAGPAVAPQGPREAPAHTPAETLHAFLDYRERQAAAGRDETAGATAAASGADEDTPAGLTAETAFQQRLRKEAVQVLQACEENQRADGGTASVTRTGSYAAPIELHGVTVRGFRCFGAEPVTFSFRDAGIVALTGRNDMDVGSLSNGSGKTAIASAAIWAVSGDLSGWLGDSGRLGLRNAAVIHHSPAVKAAHVRLSGSVGGEPFVIERSVTKSRGKLRFEVGGRDETGASATVTQASIDRRLSPHLPRVLFHSQATVMGLLEAADAKFKQALAPLVDLSLWQACEEEVKALTRKSKQRCIRAQSDVEHAARDTKRAAARAAAADAARTDASRTAEAAAAAASDAAAAAAAAAALLPALLARTDTIAAAVRTRLHEAEAARLRVWESAAVPTAGAPQSNGSTPEVDQAEAEAAQEAAKVAALQEAWRQEAARLQVHHSTTGAAAAAVAAASRAEASARLALAAAREAERAFHVPASHDSRAEAEEPHCTLCGQALRGAAAEVTQANLRAAVGEAVGRSEAAGAALQAAQETHADAAQTQEKIEAKMQAIAEQEAEHQRRWHELADAACAARAASERAAQAQQAQRSALTATLDQDIRCLHGAAADLLLCSSKLESAGGLLPQTAATAGRAAPGGPAVPYAGVNAAAAAQGDGGPVGARGAWRWGGTDAPGSVDAGMDTGGDGADESDEGLQASSRGRWLDATVEDVVDEAQRLRAQVDLAVDSAQAARQHADAAQRQLEAVRERWRDRDAVAGEAAADLQERTAEAEAAEKEQAAAEAAAAMHVELGRVFGRGGVQHFDMDSVVHDLSARTEPLLRMLAPQFQLQLHTIRLETTSKQTDTIEKRLTRVSSGQAAQEGLFLGSLSTGERRRVALALTLGYVDLLRARGAAAVDTLVLDEVHANLDREGVRRVLDVVRTLSQRCVVVVGQAGSEVAELADRHEAVVKREDGVVTLERQY